MTKPILYIEYYGINSNYDCNWHYQSINSMNHYSQDYTETQQSTLP